MKVDRNSETWLAIEALLHRHRAIATGHLRNRKSDLETTQYYRGVLDFLDELEKYEEPKPVISPMPLGPGY